MYLKAIDTPLEPPARSTGEKNLSRLKSIPLSVFRKNLARKNQSPDCITIV